MADMAHSPGTVLATLFYGCGLGHHLGVVWASRQVTLGANDERVEQLHSLDSLSAGLGGKSKAYEYSR